MTPDDIYKSIKRTLWNQNECQGKPDHLLGRLRSYHYTTPARPFGAYFMGVRGSSVMSANRKIWLTSTAQSAARGLSELDQELAAHGPGRTFAPTKHATAVSPDRTIVEMPLFAGYFHYPPIFGKKETFMTKDQHTIFFKVLNHTSRDIIFKSAG